MLQKENTFLLPTPKYKCNQRFHKSGFFYLWQRWLECFLRKFSLASFMPLEESLSSYKRKARVRWPGKCAYHFKGHVRSSYRFGGGVEDSIDVLLGTSIRVIRNLHSNQRNRKILLANHGGLNANTRIPFWNWSCILPPVLSLRLSNRMMMNQR